MQWLGRARREAADIGRHRHAHLRPVETGWDTRQVADIADVARDAGESPRDLLREVHEFRAALHDARPLSHAVDAVASSTLPATHSANRKPFGRSIAAAGLVTAAVISATTVAVIAHHETRSSNTPQVQALELTAAQQYGVLALAAQQHSTKQIAAAAGALHASMVPLIARAGADDHAARTALELLTNERSLLMSNDADSVPIAAALAQTQTLLVELQTTTDMVIPTVLAIPSVVLPPTGTPVDSPTPSGPPTSTSSPPATSSPPDVSTTPATPVTPTPSTTPDPGLIGLLNAIPTTG